MAITGASAGIGLALASAWAARGAKLVLNARDAANLETVRAGLRLPRQSVELVAGDVTEAAVQEALVERARSAFGRLDVLVNNAGRGYYARVEDVAPSELEKLLALNVMAPLALTQRALPALLAARGTVVMISSVAGVAAAPGMGAYAASKFALEALSTSLRAELAARGVRVLVVRPGPVATGFREHALSSGQAGLHTPERDQRQRPENVARQVMAALDARRDVVETSLYVRGVSFAARALPRAFRLATQRIAKK